MKDLDKKIEEKIKQLEALGREIAQLQQLLQQKQVEAIKLDGAINQLKELQNEENKVTQKE